MEVVRFAGRNPVALLAVLLGLILSVPYLSTLGVSMCIVGGSIALGFVLERIRMRYEKALAQERRLARR